MRKYRIKKPRSLFATKTFRIGLISFLSAIAPLIVPCIYSRRFPNEAEAIAILGACSTFAFLLVGRVTTDPAYTSDFLPGPNKSDFEDAARK